MPGEPAPGQRLELPPGWPPGFATGAANRRALVVLAALRGMSPRRLRELAWRTGDASACLGEVRRGRAGSEADGEAARTLDPDRLLRRAGDVGARVVGPGDEEYPPGLLDLPDPPAALFVRGARLGPGRRVAVVGARNCTPTGAEVAHDLGRALAAAGVSVVSGAARGIDSRAHEGALAAGGPTVAVLGCGIDVAYPVRSGRLLGRIVERGTVLSEYAPGVPAEPFRFPARNRLIAALSEAVVVVEGAEGSGSLITADHALDLGRQVLAVPGPVTSPLSAAPHALIRDGAGLIRGPADLLEDLGVGPGPATAPPPADLGQLEERVLAHLAGPALPEQVARAAGLSLPEVLAALTRLELLGLVRSVGGRVERRAPGP
ncbi:MAG TPA: DNA-processing protein DprA [Actinomycetota bacterium]|nr:DNA-processing protein DprA [Actinomycetota bacterium]